MEILNEFVVLIHLTGMAILVGAFILNMKTKENFPFRLMVIGAATQFVTGLILVALSYANGGDGPDNIKIGVKTLFVLGALVAAIIGNGRQKKGESKLQPFFHAAGGFAFINLVIAVLWNADLWS